MKTPAKKSPAKNPAPARGLSLAQKVAATNRWRDNLNPQRGLTVMRAVALFEQAMRGEFTELMWAYAAPYTGIECADPDLLALIELRTSALLEMDWNIHEATGPDGKDLPAEQKQLATEQAKVLRAAYDKIENLYEAIEHFELAAFRGYAHAQPVNAAGEVTLDASRFEILKQWNFVRDGSTGDWFWNPGAKTGGWRGLPAENRISFSRDLILYREVARPINRVALLKYIRANLSEKDWDAFIEIYGVPQWLIIGPANVPTEKEGEYRMAAESVAAGGSGYLPNGSDAKTPDSVRGAQPFDLRLDYLSKKLVLAGTGGMLTMLTDSTGLGSGVSDAHSKTFKKIAAGSARRISEIFQRSFDKRILAEKFPDAPVLAYFKLAANEETDAGAILDHAVKASQAGLQIDHVQLSEKTGYTITPAPVPAGGTLPPGNFQPVAVSKNRATEPAPASPAQVNDRLVAQAVADTLQVRANWLAPFFDHLEAAAKDGTMSDEDFLAALEEAANAMPELLDAAHIEEAAKPVRALLETSLVNALAAKAEATPSKTGKETQP